MVDEAFWARPARPRDGAHGVQGRMAVAVARVARRRGHRAVRRRPDLALAARARRRRPRLHAVDVRDPAAVHSAVGFGAAVAWSCTSPRSRWSARSYAEPAETFAVNVSGTAHVLDAVRAVGGVEAVVVVTSDKCYAPRPDGEAHRETDPLGGHDPYCASQGGGGARRRRLPRLLRPAAGHRAGRERHRRRRLGRRPAAARRDGRRARGRRPSRCAVARGGAAVAARPQPARRLPRARPGARCATRPFATGWNFGPAAEEALPVRALVDRLATPLGRRDRGRRAGGRPPARDGDAAARLDPRARAARLAAGVGPRRGPARRSSTGTAPTSAAPTCARPRSRRSRPTRRSCSPPGAERCRRRWSPWRAPSSRRSQQSPRGSPSRRPPCCAFCRAGPRGRPPRPASRFLSAERRRLQPPVHTPTAPARARALGRGALRAPSVCAPNAPRPRGPVREWCRGPQTAPGQLDTRARARRRSVEFRAPWPQRRHTCARERRDWSSCGRHRGCSRAAPPHRKRTDGRADRPRGERHGRKHDKEGPEQGHSLTDAVRGARHARVFVANCEGFGFAGLFRVRERMVSVLTDEHF